MTMKELVAKFNKLTGGNRKSFKTLVDGQRQLNTVIKLTENMKVRVNKLNFKSVKHAFENYNIPMEKEENFRLKLFVKGRAMIKGHIFFKL